MWWGGFSEVVARNNMDGTVRLNPHVVGRFFRALASDSLSGIYGLNPHVVGRFFRGSNRTLGNAFLGS